MKAAVLEVAHLQGMGRECVCEIAAIRNSQAGEVRYSQCNVLSAPADLPDGEYTVSIRGTGVIVRRQDGLWLAAETAAYPRYWPAWTAAN